LTFRLIQKTWF